MPKVSKLCTVELARLTIQTFFAWFTQICTTSKSMLNW